MAKRTKIVDPKLDLDGTNNPVVVAIAEEIRAKQLEIDRLKQDINDIAKAHIPDFHFTSHQVSTFWTCAKSPIGVCVFSLDDYGCRTYCLFCGNPDERK